METEFVVMVCNRPVCGFCVLSTMRDQGGSFVQRLAETWWAADGINKRILTSAFFQYFQEYAKNVIIWKITCEDCSEWKSSNHYA